MSQKTDLQSNNTDLQSILNTINNLPEAGSGGGSSGGNIETCTVTINSFAANIRFVMYVSYEDGKYVYNDITYSPELSTVTCTNVLCGGTFEIYSSYNYCDFNYNADTAIYCDGGAGSYIKILPISDTVIEIFDDD